MCLSYLVNAGPGDSCDEHGQLSSPLTARNRAGQRSSVPRSGGGMSSGLARLCSWLVIATWMGTATGISSCWGGQSSTQSPHGSDWAPSGPEASSRPQLPGVP